MRISMTKTDKLILGIMSNLVGVSFDSLEALYCKLEGKEVSEEIKKLIVKQKDLLTELDTLSFCAKVETQECINRIIGEGI